MKLQNFLIQPRALRAMAITVCILTNLFFITLFLHPAEYSVAMLVGEVKVTSGAGMVVLFLLLRHALREITAPKDSELDEMELEMRDSAYRLGYLVVRRVGLGISIVGVLLLPILQEFANLGVSSMTQNGITTSNIGFFNDTKGIRSYLHLYLSGYNLLQIGLGLVLVMTFTAYCFPLVILAWRYAGIRSMLTEEERLAPPRSFEPEAKNSLDVVSQVLKLVAAFRLQLALVAIGWPLLFALGIGLGVLHLALSAWANVVLELAALLMLFTLWVLFAGMAKQLKIIRLLGTARRKGLIQTSSIHWVRALAIVTGVASLSLPVCYYLFAPTVNEHVIIWPVIWIASITTLVSQTASFMIAKAIAKAGIDSADV